MSKKHYTKDRIMAILRERDCTMTELSDRLGLAPSTVKQHLNELRAERAVTVAEDPHFRRFKYYTANAIVSGRSAVR